LTLQIIFAAIFNNFKPLYKSLILIFLTDLLIIFLSFAGLIQPVGFGIHLLFFIILVIAVLFVVSINLAKFGSFSMKSIGNIANVDKKSNDKTGLKFFKLSGRVTFILLIVPLIFLLSILWLINDLVPFFNNFPNLCKILLLMVIQLCFIAIFSEVFNRQIVSELISKKIALLNKLKLLTFSREYEGNEKINLENLNYLYKLSNLFIIQKQSSFFFFEKNSVLINVGFLQSGNENELENLLHEELNYYLEP